MPAPEGMLGSWNDGPTRNAIVDFVARVTDEGGPDFLEPAARVAVLDNDGTLWCEKPMPIQLDFTVRRLAELAEADPSLRARQPYRAAYENDLGWLGAAMTKHSLGDDDDLRLLLGAVTSAFDTVSVEDYDEQVRAFIATADHPTLHRPYRTCAYLPMIELLRFLEAHQFTCYIVSGGDRDFMRPVADELYGIPPERVVGSALGLTYLTDGETTSLRYQASMDFFDDGPEKPIRIWSRIGRRPVLAVGNSNGDLAMLQFSGTATTPSLRLLVLHDDVDREFDYTAGAEQALAVAAEQGWLVVSVKNDWEQVLLGDAPRSREQVTPSG